MCGLTKAGSVSPLQTGQIRHELRAVLSHMIARAGVGARRGERHVQRAGAQQQRVPTLPVGHQADRGQRHVRADRQPYQPGQHGARLIRHTACKRRVWLPVCARSSECSNHARPFLDMTARAVPDQAERNTAYFGTCCAIFDMQLPEPGQAAWPATARGRGAMPHHAAAACLCMHPRQSQRLWPQLSLLQVS